MPEQSSESVASSLEQEDIPRFTQSPKPIYILAATDRLRTLRRSRCKELGFMIIESSSVDESLEILGQHAISIVVADWFLPEGGAFTLTKRMDENGKYSHMPFLLLSGRPSNTIDDDDPGYYFRRWQNSPTKWTLSVPLNPDILLKVIIMMLHPEDTSNRVAEYGPQRL